MRYIFLDTETTGISPKAGHKIIEIGCLEMSSRKLTGFDFHRYLNPMRAIDKEAIAVHGLTEEFLADKPIFKSIAGDFIDFIRDATLIIHNAPFDLGFLNHELSLLGYKEVHEYTTDVIDSLVLARKLYPGKKNSLDALCARFEISNAHRHYHGALLDAHLLAQVYLKMTGGQSMFDFDMSQNQLSESINPFTSVVKLTISQEDLHLHEQLCQKRHLYGF